MGRSASFPDLYEVLGASPDAGPEELEAAYRARTLELDPEALGDSEAEQQFRDLSHAYAVLSKPRSRLLYDRLAYPGRRDTSERHEEDVPEPVPESAPLDDDGFGWLFGDDELEPSFAAPARREDPVMRSLAGAALVVSIVFLALILLG